MGYINRLIIKNKKRRDQENERERKKNNATSIFD